MFRVRTDDTLKSASQPSLYQRSNVHRYFDTDVWERSHIQVRSGLDSACADHKRSSIILFKSDSSNTVTDLSQWAWAVCHLLQHSKHGQNARATISLFWWSCRMGREHQAPRGWHQQVGSPYFPNLISVFVPRRVLSSGKGSAAIQSHGQDIKKEM